jgi:thiol-disulfide isomerase/thioredoxin
MQYPGRFCPILSALVLALVSLSILCTASFAEGPPVGSQFPAITLPAPEKPEDQQYLKLPGKAPFTVSQIQTPIVIVQIFSMYCPHCQKDAPRTNELFKKLVNHPKLKDAVRLIGIGIGNSAYEVEFFKNTYHIPFPLFPDGDFTIHKHIGEVRTPYFIVVQNSPKGSEIIYSRSGAIPDLDAFVNMLAKKAGK